MSPLHSVMELTADLSLLRLVTDQRMTNERETWCYDVTLAIAVFELVFQQWPMLPML
jgi:hypothetical protein